MSQQRDVIEQKQGPNQIVRIRSDSETNLDDLFKAVMQPKGNQAHYSRPMRQRNLPPSFFQQPERGSKSASHSRESSADNTFSSPPPQPISQNNSNNNNNNVASPGNCNNSNNAVSPSPPPHPSGLPINHPRAHSSPASLQQTYNNAGQHQHLRQQSYDITDTIPLPPGWEMARTAGGQKYFLNHLTQTTTWTDPRKKLSSSSLSSSSGVTCSSPSTSPASSLLNLQIGNNLGPLPDGWEQATTAEGEIYFINHKTRSTSWYDPRLPPQLQNTPLVPILGYGAHSQSILGLSSQQLQVSTVADASVTGSVTVVSNQTIQQQQQQMRLQRLQMERERLRNRQQEILKNSNLGSSSPMLNDYIRRSLHEESVVPSSSSNITSESTQSNPTNIDPFLGADADFHSRQESGDSGLGLSSNYSLPNTPEDYLMGMDEGAEEVLLDIAELNLEPIPSGTLDMVPENMDSDDLEPSLHEELNADILSDVEALLNKESVMKWL